MTEHDLTEYDEFGIVLPFDAGQKAMLRGYTGPAAFDTLDKLMAEEAAAEHDSWRPVNLAELGEQPPVQPTLGNVGIVYPGKRHVFSGPQESAKTLAAYAIAIEVTRNNATVVIIDFEMGRWDARDRLTDLGATPDELSRIHYVDPSEPATLERITRLLRLRPELVVIDAAAGAYDIQGLDDNKRQDVERFTSMYVRDFWRNDIATIVLDHVVKNTENRGKYAIGSERKVGGADVHLGFEVVTPIRRGGSGLYKILTHKDRGGYLQRGRLADLHLESDIDTHRITWEFRAAEHAADDQPWRPTKLMERVSQYLEQQAEPVSFQHVMVNVKGRDSMLKEALEHLIALGHATHTRGETGARLVEFTSTFRSEETHIQGAADLGRQAEQTTSNSVEKENGSIPVSMPEPPAQTIPLHGLPTPAQVCPADPSAPLPALPPSTEGQAEGQRKDEAEGLPETIDVYDADLQHLLDDPDY